MEKKLRSFFAVLLLSTGVPACSAQTDTPLDLVPIPAEVNLGSGVFRIDAETRIVVSAPANGSLENIGHLLAGFLEPVLGFELPVVTGGGENGNSILLVVNEGSDLGEEAYHLRSQPASVTISGSAEAGIFYGVQTLRQMVRAVPGESFSGTIRAAEISDHPRFGYRGMHLDVGRHMFPVAFIKKYIDLISTYKFNRFHWHLTEDQGWRIEILKYPRLTEVGAYRRETAVEKNFEPLAPYVGDGQRYGGFYTQNEVREVVAYASARQITIVPEIEMPGHSSAALAAYPELACTEGPFEVSTFWGVRDDIYCPSERTFGFLEDVLTEVMELFPGEYIHIGGDEAPKVRWRNSRLAQDVIRREGLADEHELQSYFIRLIEAFLTSHERRLIGWDEILEGGLAPDATVMSWRGMTGGIEAARQGHDVVMTPGSHVYFDHYQGPRDLEPLAIGGFSPLEKVYDFEPVPAELSPEEQRHIIGAQANVWTEYMKTSDYVEYMVAPRLLALSEVVWSPAVARDWESFASRLPRQLQFLDGMDINYRVPSVTGLQNDRLTLDEEITLELSTLAGEGARIRYTTDGTEPDENSPLYDGPLELSIPAEGLVVSGKTYMSNGRSSTMASARFERTTLHAAADVKIAGLQSGLQFAYYESDRIRSISMMEAMEPVRRGIAERIELEDTGRLEEFGYVFNGFLRISEDAVYRFDLVSDDGSKLWIGDDLVVDHGGLHGARTKSGAIGLAAGYHPIRVAFFQAGGGKALSLEMFDDVTGTQVEIATALAH